MTDEPEESQDQQAEPDTQDDPKPTLEDLDGYFERSRDREQGAERR